MPDLLDRMPPASVEAEKCLLGSLLIDPECIDDVAEVVRRPEDFYAHAHQQMYAAMLDLHNEGGGIDVVLLAEYLRDNGTLDAIGGADYLAEIVDSVPSAANAKFYAATVRDKAKIRAVIQAGGELVRAGYDDASDADAIVARAESKLFALLEDSARSEAAGLGDVLQEALARIDSRHHGRGVTGVPTGIVSLDEICGGFQPQELVIVAARTSVGKTVLALNIAQNVATGGGAVLFVSLEMSKLELADRMLLGMAGVDALRASSGQLSASERGQVVAAGNELANLPLWIKDDPYMGVALIAAEARRMKRRGKLTLLVVDYLQLVQPADRKEPREQQVAGIVRGLKRVAREVNVPVLCLAQLNRQAEGTGQGEPPRPKLHHLRESGAIEQDADKVLLLWRDDRTRDKGAAECDVAKNRNGRCGVAYLAWQGSRLRFVAGTKPGRDEPAYQHAYDGQRDWTSQFGDE